MRTPILILTVMLAAISGWPQATSATKPTTDAAGLPDTPMPQQDWDAIMRRVDADSAALKRRLKKGWHPGRIVDTGFVLDHVILSASVVADAETTVREIETHPNVVEWNAFFGSRPGRLRVYGTEVPLTAAIVALDYYLKQRAQRYLRDQYIPNEVDSDMLIPWWRMLPLSGALVHGFIAWGNAAQGSGGLIIDRTSGQVNGRPVSRASNTRRGRMNW